MRITIRNELLVINILVFLLAAVIIFVPSNTLRAVLGLPAVLLFPGYAITAALFPGNKGPGLLERLIISLGTSIALVPMIGLLLHYIPWGINVYSVLISLIITVAGISIFGHIRRQALPPAERFALEFHIPLLRWKGTGILDKTLSFLLIASVLGASGTLVYVVVTPNIGEKFTEFYVLGAGGVATKYPRELLVGDEASVIVGIINQEQETASYRVEVMMGGETSAAADPVRLKAGEKFEQELRFTAGKPGGSQKVEFLLYKDDVLLYGDGGIYAPIYIWINVTEFYIPGVAGMAARYPAGLAVGETASVTVGIINWEPKDSSYRIEVWVEGEIRNVVGPIRLGPGEKKEQELRFSAAKPGNNQKVKIFLYKGDALLYGQDGLYSPISIEIDVRQS